jgi:hypothetical protein
MFLKVCERGLEITEILPNGPLTRLKCAGKVRVGDILTKVDGKVVGDLNSAMEALNGLQGTAVILTVLRYSLVGVPDTISVCVVRGSDTKREETPARMQGRRDEVALDSSLAQRTQEQSMHQILEQAQGITSCADPTSAPLHAALLRAEAAEAQLVNLQGHFNALLQVLSRRCLNNRD